MLEEDNSDSVFGCAQLLLVRDEGTSKQVFVFNLSLPVCVSVFSDLLFLVALTSSVCVVSEAIKKVERWRGAERNTSMAVESFHEV